jgi:hypothetical protein
MHYLPIFVGITAGAVLVQTGILVALFVTVRRSISRMDGLVSDVKMEVMPIAKTAKAMLSELKPKITVIAANVGETTNIVHRQIEQLDAALSEAAVKARLQLVRAEELIHNTTDHVHETSYLFYRGVVPIRRLSALLKAATATLAFLRRRPKRHVSSSRD